ncbi:hypothetical protein [Bacillus salipaludis]|uniref:Uncharacterized protein n=1 Tax=Bacillus salipaludis TaxID=2547811 RepID=A0AA90TRV7_9BACI|nr:hypothetical protein [Bacillus salipaludis]MDQ6596625.1 hypothetical protein [Bacillus salipaludis]
MLDRRNEPGWADMRSNRSDRCNCSCNGVGEENSCCSDSRLRGPGIRRTATRGGYFADADLVCSGLCIGHDRDTVYEWRLFPISGNAELVGPTRKVGNDRIEVSGTGEFELDVRVTFICGAWECVREATVTFRQ